MDRDIFLGRVGRAAMSAELPEPPGVTDELPIVPEEDLVSLFRERAQEVDAVVHEPPPRRGAERE